MTHNPLEYYLALPYTIALTPDRDGTWFVEIPALDGCMTTAADAAEALTLIADAKRAWLMAALELGIPIPHPALTPTAE